MSVAVQKNTEKEMIVMDKIAHCIITTAILLAGMTEFSTVLELVMRGYKYGTKERKHMLVKTIISAAIGMALAILEISLLTGDSILDITVGLLIAIAYIGCRFGAVALLAHIIMKKTKPD